jgi:hypothetical protein
MLTRSKLHPNLAKLAFSKQDLANLTGACFETGATERALTQLPHTLRFNRMTVITVMPVRVYRLSEFGTGRYITKK